MAYSRIAALYDIHANLPALEAVLREVRVADVDVVLVGGDVVPGPMPRETVDCLLHLDIPVHFIRGNGDREVLARMRGTESSGVPERVREVIRWTAQQLDGYEQLLADWPETRRLALDDLGEVLFCHATPRSDTEIFTRTTPEDRLRSIFDDEVSRLVVCGHTHMQFDRTIGRTRVVNAGSVGMPFGKPGACWCLLNSAIHLRHTTYELDRAAKRIRSTTYPQAAEFAAGNVLQPPSEAQMLETFARAELR